MPQATHDLWVVPWVIPWVVPALEAMTLVFDQPNLPFPGGVLTPAVACGEALATRLINSGVKFKMDGWHLGNALFLSRCQKF